MDRQKVTRYLRRTWKEWRLTVFLIVFVVIPVKSSLADWNWVPSGSMLPTILEGDLIYVDKIAYDLRLPLTMSRLAKWADPERGDIVICFSPEDDTRLVKRVIAIPGDTVEMRNNVVLLNGRPLSYTRPDPSCKEHLSTMLKDRSRFATEDLDSVSHTVMSTPRTRAMRSFGPVTVPQGQYFVMGDNRDNSRDSRTFGLVERQAIVGKAKRVIISFDITDKYQPRLTRFFDALR
jgi:signal peptidase I